MSIVVQEPQIQDEPVQDQPPAEVKEYTFEELAELNNRVDYTDLVQYELIEGELVPVSSSGWQSSLTPIWSAIFVNFLKNHPVGSILVDQGYIFQRKPRRTMMAPDLSFISKERIPEGGIVKKGYWEFVPDLAVEIVSPDDKLYEVFDKAEKYLGYGVREVWIALPSVQAVIVYRSKQDVKYLVSSDRLERPEIIPGFSVPVAELFVEL